jgi:hypothetical protein
LKKLKRTTLLNNILFINEGTEEYGKLNWIKDKDKIIETIFFLHYPCNSVVLLDLFGNYYSYRGKQYN